MYIKCLSSFGYSLFPWIRLIWGSNVSLSLFIDSLTLPCIASFLLQEYRHTALTSVNSCSTGCFDVVTYVKCWMISQNLFIPLTIPLWAHCHPSCRSWLRKWYWSEQLRLFCKTVFAHCCTVSTYHGMALINAGCSSYLFESWTWYHHITMAKKMFWGFPSCTGIPQVIPACQFNFQKRSMLILVTLFIWAWP